LMHGPGTAARILGRRPPSPQCPFSDAGARTILAAGGADTSEAKGEAMSEFRALVLLATKGVVHLTSDEEWSRLDAIISEAGAAARKIVVHASGVRDEHVE